MVFVTIATNGDGMICFIFQRECEMDKTQIPISTFQTPNNVASASDLFFDIGPFPPGCGPQALHTKCKTCFEGSRMILTHCTLPKQK